MYTFTLASHVIIHHHHVYQNYFQDHLRVLHRHFAEFLLLTIADALFDDCSSFRWFRAHFDIGLVCAAQPYTIDNSSNDTYTYSGAGTEPTANQVKFVER